MLRFPAIAAALALTLFVGCRADPRRGLIGDYKVGERLQVGPMVYNVYETQYLVKLGDGPDAKIPKDRFFVVHLSAVNGGGAQNDLSIPALSLIDDSGKVYNESENGSGAPQWLGFARRVRPAESLTGDVVFDVPPRHYRLRIPDETDEHYALVDLPLSFGESAPSTDSASPLSPK